MISLDSTSEPAAQILADLNDLLRRAQALLGTHDVRIHLSVHGLSEDAFDRAHDLLRLGAIGHAMNGQRNAHRRKDIDGATLTIAAYDAIVHEELEATT